MRYKKKVRTSVLERFRTEGSPKGTTMNDLYLIAGISKQGHHQSVIKLSEEVAKEPAFLGLMHEVRQMHPGMGLRTMYDQFQPQGIGRDAFIALGIREGYRLRAYENPQTTTRSVKNRRFPNLLAGRRFTDVNQLWSSDIFYFPLNGRHYYGILIMDVYSRRIIGWSMADNMRAENNIKALQRAFTLRGVNHYQGKLIHHSDRGSQYVSDDYTESLSDRGVLISMCKEVLENAHIERANGTIKNDYLRLWPINTERQLFEAMERAANNYNLRKHKSLGMTPIDFENHIKELTIENRVEMEIFIYKQNVENPLQLQLNLNS
jgi:putative transposase